MDQPVPLPRAKSRTRIPVPSLRRANLEDDDASIAATIVHVAEVHNARRESQGGSSGEGEAEDDSSGRGSAAGGGEKRRKKVKRKGTFLVRHKTPIESTTDELNVTTPSDKEAKEIPISRKSSRALTSSKASSIESIKLPIEDTTSSGTPKPSSQILGFESERKQGINTSSIDSIKEATTFKIPAPPRRGSATETLSSSSDRERSRVKLKPLVHSSRHKKPSGYATETPSEDSSQQNSPSRASSAPLPKPRQRLSIPGPTTSPEVIPRAGSGMSTSAELKIHDHQPKSSPEVTSARAVSQFASPTLSTKEIVTTQQSSSGIPGITSSPLSFLNVERERATPDQKASPIGKTSLEGSAKPAPDSPMSYYTSSSVDYKDVGVISPLRAKRPKKKRKIKDNPGASTENSERGSSTNVDALKHDDGGRDELIDKNTVVCITVHRCEPLRMKDLHKRPFIRVHLIDSKTKVYRRSAFGKNDVDVVQTQPFDHIQNRSVIPSWDEDLILMEPASHVVSSDCVLIFELLEAETDDIIAWAFLKPMAANGKQNVGMVLRLQLYKPVKSRNPKNADASIPMAFSWYMKSKHSAYRSTILVSIHSIDSRLVLKPDSPTAPAAVPSKNHTRRRSSQMSSSSPHNMKLSEAEKELIGVVWSRLPSLSCKLPNKVNSSLPAGPDGGMSVNYSRSGLLVACHTSNTISVFTYKGSRYLTLSGHHGLVYDLNWSPDDSFLLSSSADTTACVWNVKLKQATPVAVLSHPSYVYCGTWVGPSLVVTGCYDRALRLWDLAGVPTLLPQNTSVAPSSGVVNTHAYEPLQCISGHKARINTLAVLSSDEILISGDSEGVLVFWKLSTTLPRQLELSREVRIRELRGQVINRVSAHPGGKRILVATRDSTLRMIDLQSTSVIQWFHGGVSSKLQAGSCFCGCGSRVLSCSEDGNVSVWDANTGERTALYKGLYLLDSPATITYHPKDNMFALVSHKVGAFPSLVLSSFTRDSSGGDIGMEWLDNRSEKLKSSSSVSDISLRSSRESVADRVTTRKKKRGILRTLLQGGTKFKQKKGISNDGYTDTESGEGAASEVNRFERKKRSTYRVGDTLDSDGEVNNRLTDIIKRMDNLLMTASPSHPHVY